MFTRKTKKYYIKIYNKNTFLTFLYFARILHNDSKYIKTHKKYII
jgi:hypothetical protein